MMRKTPPSLPREHGAWVMLAIPLVVASIGVGPPRLASLLIVPAMVLLFLARYAALPAATRLVKKRHMPEGYIGRRLLWSAIYLTCSAGFLAAAIALVDPAARVEVVLLAGITGVLGASHAGLALIGRDRRAWAEIIGFAGLACAAPLVMATAGQPVDARAWSAAGLCLCYFLSSLAYVRAYRMRKHARRRAVIMCVSVHAALAGVVLASWYPGYMPALGVAALGPMLVRTTWGLSHPPESVRALGVREIPVAVGFTALASLAFAL